VYLLDTDALSLTNAATGYEAEAVVAWRAWVVAHQDALFLSVVSLMEVRFGVEKSFAKGATRKSAALRKWLAAAEAAHRDRVLPVTAEIAHRAGALLWGAVASGVKPSAEDALVAATAAVAGLTVLSRNGRHMTALRAVWIDPLGLPPSIAPGS
jgi:predicted nucleic acid-binding protein